MKLLGHMARMEDNVQGYSKWLSGF
jgi:hypothetical protein